MGVDQRRTDLGRPAPVIPDPNAVQFPPDAHEEVLPYPFDEFVCPKCERKIPTRNQYILAKPAKFAHLLNDVLRCPFCSFDFSYKQPTRKIFSR